mmetsp:Transcript_10685/g.26363  ORF Transcript_10685/g.26363 Transcript_10685/m.26363 type:complete len:616 (-) Transcript_10685:459-2306(-)
MQPHPAGEFAPAGNGYYNAKSRARTDVWATIAFGLLTTVVCVWGIAAFAKAGQQQDPQYYSEFMTNSMTCSDVKGFDAAWSKYLAMQPAQNSTMDSFDDSFGKAFTKTISAMLPITAVAGIIGSVCYVLLFRRFPAGMVNISIIATIVWSVIMTIAGFASGAVAVGIILLICTLLTAAFFWWIRGDIKMCARLMGVSGQALTDNGWLIPATMGVKILGIGLLIYQLAAVICASNVVTYSPAVNVIKTPDADPTLSSQIGQCTYTQGGAPVDCCQMRWPAWVAPFIGIACFAMAWLSQVLLQAKLSIVAHVIAQWYWHPAGQWGSGDSKAATGAALRHTLNTNFGTVSFAALIITLIEMLRSALNSKKRDNIFWCMLNCIVQPILAMCEMFTRFATIAAAITGQPFVVAAKDIFGVLKRNFLQTYTLWWIPGFATGLTVFLFSLAWGVLSFFVAWVGNSKQDSDNQVAVSWITALICFLVMLLILSYAAGILLDCINCVYICFAMDRDQKVVTRPDIHTIYMALPTLQGAVVEQPGGEIEYGRPDQAPPPAGAAPTQPLYSNPYGYSSSAAAPAPYTYTPATGYGASGSDYPAVAPQGGAPGANQQGYTNTKYPGF